MRKILVGLILIVAACFGQDFQAEGVEVQEFSSPAEFNRAITTGNGLKKKRLRIYTEQLNTDFQNVVFEDDRGNTLKKLPISRYANQRVVIGFEIPEALIVTSARVYFGNTPDASYEVANYITDVYDSTGVLRFSYKDSTSILTWFNKKYYVTYPNMDGVTGWIYLVDKSGKKVRELSDITFPQVIVGNNQFTIIFVWAEGLLYSYSNEGTLRWRKEFGRPMQSELSLSDEGRICLGAINKIYLLNEYGIGIKEIPIETFRNGTVKARISQNGQYIFWAHRNQVVTNLVLPSCELGCYNLYSNEVVWRSVLTAENGLTWTPAYLSVTEDGKYALTLFYNGYLFIHNNQGSKVFEGQMGPVRDFHDYIVRPVNDSFIVHNLKTNMIHYITISEL